MGGDCVSSSNYPGRHGNRERCSVTMNEDASVTPGGTFNLETCCDNLVIGGVDVESANSVPRSLSAGDTFTWSSDGSVTREGWQLCFSNPIGSSTAPTQPETSPPITTRPQTTGTPVLQESQIGDSGDCSNGKLLQCDVHWSGSTCRRDCLEISTLAEALAHSSGLWALEHFHASDSDEWADCFWDCYSGCTSCDGTGYFRMTGDCDIQGDCVSSSNYPGRHGNRERCSVTMHQDASVTPGGTFNLETCCDNLVIGGVDVESANSVPRSLSAGDTFTWSSDGSVTREGWQLCFSNPETTQPDTTEPQTTESTGYFRMTGDCDIQGDCVSSSNYPERHGNRERCSVTMNEDASVTPGGTFNLETCCDNLVIGGVDVESANSVPRSLSAGDTFTWSSDGSV